jgi:hypothetical protein
MGYKNDDFADRLSSAAKAKTAVLEKFRQKPGPDDPGFVERQAAQKAIMEAREQRAAERKLARDAEIAQKAAAEAARQAEEAARKAAAAARDLAIQAERKAARDARYAARKARRK